MKNKICYGVLNLNKNTLEKESHSLYWDLDINILLFICNSLKKFKKIISNDLYSIEDEEYKEFFEDIDYIVNVFKDYEGFPIEEEKQKEYWQAWNKLGKIIPRLWL